ncbi:ABC transporter ATP-binding protein [Ilumatobacter nonamiensis]|uniref:ABC transporter ATP-binding protein n=1 Tax=Ilumatobacter nonamiensis TaxID=467093 RepID=UPI00058F8BE9|nr:ABC transporter ATP-binding protein [Ilumatobacter nonamiensis]
MSGLTFDTVDVSYDDRAAVVGFSNEVASGEWVGLIGPNGAGKSSLLRAVAGLTDSDGVISVDGRPLAAMSIRERARHVAYVAQNPITPEDMSAFDYVLLGRWPYVGRFGAESSRDRKAVDEVFERLRLIDFRERRLGELSGGERQRIVLARALAQETSVLLLDEPTSALDIGHQQQALELVTELRCHQQLTVVAAMHDLTLAGIYSDRLVMLDDGIVVADGSAAEVLTAERLGDVYHVCVTVDIDPDDGAVVVVPRRGFPVDGS